MENVLIIRQLQNLWRTMLVSCDRHGKRAELEKGEDMLKKIALSVLAILVIVLLMAAMKPNSFALSRPIAIKAPPEQSSR